MKKLKYRDKFVILKVNSTKRLSYAMIHRSSCGHSKKPNTESGSSYCHGYFDTYIEALDFANSLGVKEIQDCHFCDPRHY